MAYHIFKNSTAIEKAYYGEKSKRLTLHMVKGQDVVYFGVPSLVWVQLIQHDEEGGVGKFFNTAIRGHFRYDYLP